MSNLFLHTSIAEILQCETLGILDGAVKSVVIDSRAACPGSLFVPLVGEVTDGNLYIEGAIKGGCRTSLVSRSYFFKEQMKIESLSLEYGAVFFIVDDGLKALHRLASAHIARFKDLKVVAITGSSGKTTTKEVLGSIVKADRSTLVTEGNYNSETGLPLTVFRIGAEHRAAVLEMGMSRPGEIKALVDIAHPDMAIITNIGSAHIGFFGSRDGIAAEKKAAFANFNRDNKAIIPTWDDFYRYLKEDVNGDVISVSDNPAYITGVEDLGFEGWCFFYEDVKVHYPYMGRYNLLNAFMAIASARELGVSNRAVVKGLEDLPAMFGRGEILNGKNRVIRDCYNANPDSTLSSLKLLGKTKWDGEKIPVIGSMLELGDRSFEEHKKIAEYAVTHFPKVIFFGDEYEKVFKLYKEKSGTLYFSVMEDLKGYAAEHIESGSLVLLKASRGVRLEELTDSLI